MCTAITYDTKDHYFGRNLDLEYSYKETVTITPGNYEFQFKKMNKIKNHYAMIGMAYVVDDYPLYYDAINEKGLAIAGLNFPGNADYKGIDSEANNIAPFELIPWILSQCQNIDEVKALLDKINIIDINFKSDLPNTPLHWLLADKNTSITVECVKDGLKIYDNPVGVLTNNPTFDVQMFHLNQYMYLSPQQPYNHFSKKIDLKHYCQGMGAIGLPGDFTSTSRFIKAAFIKANSLSGDSEVESVHQFFHILNSVAFPRGSVDTGNGQYDITVYSACCNLDRGIYYYTTYENSRIIGVDMYKEDLQEMRLISYHLIKNEEIFMQNKKR